MEIVHSYLCNVLYKAYESRSSAIRKRNNFYQSDQPVKNKSRAEIDDAMK